MLYRSHFQLLPLDTPMICLVGRCPNSGLFDIHTLASEFKHSNGGNFIPRLSFSNFARGCQELIVFQPFFNVYSLVTVSLCTIYITNTHFTMLLVCSLCCVTGPWRERRQSRFTTHTRADAIKKVIRGHNVHKYFRENCRVPSQDAHKLKGWVEKDHLPLPPSCVCTPQCMWGKYISASYISEFSKTTTINWAPAAWRALLHHWLRLMQYSQRGNLRESISESERKTPAGKGVCVWGGGLHVSEV